MSELSQLGERLAFLSPCLLERIGRPREELARRPGTALSPGPGLPLSRLGTWAVTFISLSPSFINQKWE